MKEAIEKKFKTAHSMWDLYVPFMELGVQLLKPMGRFGMIVKDTLGEVNYTKKLIEYIEKNYHLYQIDFFPTVDVFEDAAVKNKIAFVKKHKNTIPTKRILHHPTISDTIDLEYVEDSKKYVFKTAHVKISTKDTLPLGHICFTSYGLRLNSDKYDTQFKFKKEDLLSETKNSIHKRLYTEGKYLEDYVVQKELYVEWDTERCPDRLVRKTFPELYEPEKILMSRQKRVAAYSDSHHICDNTIIVGILAKDLSDIDNSNIRKYYNNLTLPREEIEKNSRGFLLKYILAIINSDLMKYFLKYNSGGKIDSYPDDWKKIPIKNISTTQQNKIVKKVNQLIDLSMNFHKKKNRFLDRISFELDIPKLPKILTKFYYCSPNEFLVTLEKESKKKLSLKEKDDWQDYFEDHKDEINKIMKEISELKEQINFEIYSIYDIPNNEIKIIEDDLKN